MDHKRDHRTPPPPPTSKGHGSGLTTTPCLRFYINYSIYPLQNVYNCKWWKYVAIFCNCFIDTCDFNTCWKDHAHAKYSNNFVNRNNLEIYRGTTHYQLKILLFFNLSCIDFVFDFTINLKLQ